MKTFANLMEEIVTPRRCHRCGGCVAFCTAINFGALELDDDGKPRFKEQEKCIECGLCYEICPEIDNIRQETKQRLGWTAPMGRVLDIAMARAQDPRLLMNARDGGVLTALLLHLYDSGRIDGAIVTKRVEPFTCAPLLATTRQEIIDAGGFHFDAVAGVSLVGERYSVNSPFMELMTPLARKELRRIAFVGRPCQIETMRRMETLGIVPSDAVKYYFGLYCRGNFRFGEKEKTLMEKAGGFKWDQVRKVNFKKGLQVHLKSGEIKVIDFDTLEPIKRRACRYCADFGSEFADIACGGVGTIEGWTNVILRTPLGRAVFLDAAEEKLEVYKNKNDPDRQAKLLNEVRTLSLAKKEMSERNRKESP